LLLPIGVDYETGRAPVATRLLIAANVLVALAVLALRLRSGDDFVVARVFPSVGLRQDRPDLLSAFSALFLHADWWHLAINMIVLGMFGPPVEDRIGGVRFAAFFVAGGITAEAFDLTLTASQPAGITMGASGAVAALLGAFVLFFPRSNLRLWYALPIPISPAHVLRGTLRVPAWPLILFWFGAAVGAALTGGGTGGEVANCGHVGGFIFGLAVARGSTIVLRSRRRAAAGAPGGGVGSASRLQAADAARSRVERLMDDHGKLAAWGEYERFAALFPESALRLQYQLGLGRILQRRGELEAASSALRRVADHYAEDDRAAEALYMLGRIAAELRDTEGARGLLTRVLSDYAATPWAEAASFELSQLEEGERPQ